MRVALIDTDKAGYEYSLAPIARLLLDAGHEVMAVYSGAIPPSDPRVRFGSCSWALFDYSPLTAFDPGRVVLFNGYHKAIHAAARAIERRWKTVYMEHGWLPQRDHNYIDSKGTGARSSLLRSWHHLIGNENRVGETLKKLKHEYKPTKLKISLPRDYILVPMQLERDTSIVYDSPWFKSMPSLVGFVKRHFPDFPIVVKLHPMDDVVYDFNNVTIVGGRVPIKDLFPGAQFVIGVNSTSLIEALIFEKKVGSLGVNVASGKGVFYEGERMWTNPRGLLNYKPDQRAIGETLDALYHAQYPRLHPPRTVLQKIFG
jgi:hypothetical protein